MMPRRRTRLLLQLIRVSVRTTCLSTRCGKGATNTTPGGGYGLLQSDACMLREEASSVNPVLGEDDLQSPFPPSLGHTRRNRPQSDQSVESGHGCCLPPARPAEVTRTHGWPRIGGRQRDGLLPKQDTHTSNDQGHLSTRQKNTQGNTIHKRDRGHDQSYFNSSASSTNVASFLHKTPREGMSRSMRLQCCAHDKSHAC